MRFSTFNLINKPFNVTEICENICRIFDPMAEVVGKRISFSVLDSQQMRNKTKSMKRAELLLPEICTSSGRASIPLLYGDVRRFQSFIINLVTTALKVSSGLQIELTSSYSEED